MTRLNLSALLLGATALTLPLGSTAFAQQAQQGQQAQQAATQDQALGACEQLYRLVDEAAGEKILEEFRRAPDVAEANEAESCALIISQIEETGGISEEAVAEDRGVRFVTESETFRATDTVRETVTIEQQAIVEGEVLVRQPIPEVEVEQGSTEVQVRERPGRIDVDEAQAEIIVRQKPVNVRVSVPRPTVLIEQPAPEIIITMPAPGLSVERDRPEVNVVMAEPTVSIVHKDPEVAVDVDARLVGAEEAAALENGERPRVQTRSQRVDASGQPTTDKTAEVAVRKTEPSIRFMTAEVQDEVRYNRAQPRVTYESAEPNVEVTFNEEPRVEIRQVGEPRVRIRRQGEDQASASDQNRQANAGQQATQQQGFQQATQPATAQQGQQGQQGEQGQAEMVRAEDAVLTVDRSIRSAGRALAGQDAETVRTEIERADQQLATAMESADDGQRQQMQGLRDQLALVIVALEEQDMRGAETALTDVRANLDQNAAAWAASRDAGNRQAGRLSVDDTNRLLSEGFREGAAATGMVTISAGDLEDFDVVTMNGEEIGDIERLVTNGNRVYAIIEHGGFLGIGEDEVAIPADRIAIRGGDAILLGLSEEDIEAMPEYDSKAEAEMAADDRFEIGTYE